MHLILFEMKVPLLLPLAPHATPAGRPADRPHTPKLPFFRGAFPKRFDSFGFVTCLIAHVAQAGVMLASLPAIDCANAGARAPTPRLRLLRALAPEDFEAPHAGGCVTSPPVANPASFSAALAAVPADQTHIGGNLISTLSIPNLSPAAAIRAEQAAIARERLPALSATAANTTATPHPTANHR